MELSLYSFCRLLHSAPDLSSVSLSSPFLIWCPSSLLWINFSNGKTTDLWHWSLAVECEILTCVLVFRFCFFGLFGFGGWVTASYVNLQLLPLFLDSSPTSTFQENWHPEFWVSLKFCGRVGLLLVIIYLQRLKLEFPL